MEQLEARVVDLKQRAADRETMRNLTKAPASHVESLPSLTPQTDYRAFNSIRRYREPPAPPLPIPMTRMRCAMTLLRFLGHDGSGNLYCLSFFESSRAHKVEFRVASYSIVEDLDEVEDLRSCLIA